MLNSTFEPYCLTWSICGMTHAGWAYRLAWSVLPTAGTGCSPSPPVLFRTPLASDAIRGREPLRVVKARHGTICLPHQIADLVLPDTPPPPDGRVFWATQTLVAGGGATPQP
jgi:hypothetical protein